MYTRFDPFSTHRSNFPRIDPLFYSSTIQTINHFTHLILSDLFSACGGEVSGDGSFIELPTTEINGTKFYGYGTYLCFFLTWLCFVLSGSFCVHFLQIEHVFWIILIYVNSPSQFYNNVCVIVLGLDILHCSILPYLSELYICKPANYCNGNVWPS